MRITYTLLSLLTTGAFCMQAAAQDSVSKLHALPGDAVYSRTTTEQVNDFVVDQAALHTSWNHAFGIAPIIKVSAEKAVSPSFFTGQESAQAVSRLLRANVPFVRSSYSSWSGQGFGINNDPTKNNPGVAVNTSAFTGFQFGCAFSEFSTGTTNPGGLNAALNNIIGGVVNFTPSLPSRLYVSRINAAVNGINDGCNLAAFGVGDVDEDGDVHFRADSFNAFDCGGGLALIGQNLMRVNMLARNGAALNIIGDGGPTDAAATTWMLMHDMVASVDTPNSIPTSVQGVRPILIGTNFGTSPAAGQYLFEAVAGSLTLGAPGAHLAAGLTDHRGNPAYSPNSFPALFTAADTAGISAVIAKGSTSLTDYINIFGLDTTGMYLSPIARQLPAVISDCDQPSWSNTNVSGTQQFDHYHGSVAFNGGNGQVALGKDQAGNLLAAATVYYGGPSNTDRNNYIAVSRTTPAGVTTWSVAGWTQETTTPLVSDGKIIYQNGTTPIGRLTGALFGPAIGAPMIDSVGNVWFLAGVTLNGPPVVNAVGLLRAVYDPVNFCYKLELVMKEGDVFKGRNSTTNYKVSFLNVSGGTSISPGTAWSGNISAAAFEGQNPAALNVQDSNTLGGLVISAGIIYDVNNDGQYIKSTGPNGVPGSPDEDYQVLLYIAAAKDCNNNSIPDDSDIFNGTSQDSNGNGIPDECENQQPGVDLCRPSVVGGPVEDGWICPCSANQPTTPGAGCNALNSIPNGGGPTGGSKLSSTGTASLLTDTLHFTASSLPLFAGESCYLLSGTTKVAPLTFGQGLRCCAGTIKRLQIHSPVPTGTTTWPQAGDFAPTIHQRAAQLGDNILAGQSRCYFVQYRATNIVPGCVFPANFGATQSQSVVWGP